VNIVLASGFLLPQQFGPVEYFRGVRAHLETAGHKVLATTVPPRASCEERAQELGKAIQVAFGNEPVHLIGHSMGGLDCRMMVGRNFNGLGEEGRVVSLTTLSTPHQGSPVADLVVGDESDDLRGQVVAAIQRLGIDTAALFDLTTKAAREKRIPDILTTHPKIKYFSYGASGRPNPPHTAGLLQASYQYLKVKKHVDNDGAVPVDSMRYGVFQEPFWPCDHIEEMGYDLDTFLVPSAFNSTLDRITGFFSRTLGLGSPRFDHMAKFDEIVAKLNALEPN
jgi:triacylglycerol lipase